MQGNRELLLPADFQDYASEAEAKGVLRDVPVRVGTGLAKVTFYDPVRLGQDLAEELALRASAELARVLVVPRVSEEHLRAAVARAPTEFFELTR